MRTFFYKRILLSYFLLSITGAIAQPLLQEGTIYTDSGDTIVADIVMYRQNVLLRYERVIFYIGEEKVKLRPSKVKRIVIDTVEYHRLTFSRDLLRKGEVTINYLAQIIQVGEVSLYKVYFERSHQDLCFEYDSDLIEKYYLSSNGNIISVYRTAFRSIIRKAFEGCETLLLKMKEEKLKYRDIYEIVKIGNASCAKDSD